MPPKRATTKKAGAEPKVAKMPTTSKKTTTPEPTPPPAEVTEPVAAPSQPQEDKPKSILKTTASKSSKELSFSEELEEVSLVPCSDEGCDVSHEPEEEELEEVYVDVDVDENAEEDEEEPEDLQERYDTVPITSVTSPRYIARSNSANRVLSPRRGDIRSPRRQMSEKRKKSNVTNYANLDSDDLVYSEEDIPLVQLNGYENIRAADVITWLIVVGRCPYVFRDTNGEICCEEDAESVDVVQRAHHIDESFEVFECIQGILAFSPTNDIDFGYDEETAHHLIARPDHVYITPVISSGSNVGAIRFVDDMELWGMIPLDKYEMIKTRDDYRNVVKRMPMEPIELVEEEEEGDVDE